MNLDPEPSGAPAQDRSDLRLYIAGRTPKCARALRNLQQMCDALLPDRYQIEVVELLESPGLAGDEQILAVPTLVRRVPEPARKIVGDLSDTERLPVGSQLRPRREDR